MTIHSTTDQITYNFTSIICHRTAFTMSKTHTAVSYNSLGNDKSKTIQTRKNNRLVYIQNKERKINIQQQTTTTELQDPDSGQVHIECSGANHICVGQTLS